MWLEPALTPILALHAQRVMEATISKALMAYAQVLNQTQYHRQVNQQLALNLLDVLRLYVTQMTQISFVRCVMVIFSWTPPAKDVSFRASFIDELTLLSGCTLTAGCASGTCTDSVTGFVCDACEPGYWFKSSDSSCQGKLRKPELG